MVDEKKKISEKKNIVDWSHRGVDDTFEAFSKGMKDAINELRSLAHQVVDLKNKKANVRLTKQLKALRKLKAEIKKTYDMF